MKKEERKITDKYIKDMIIDTIDLEGIRVPVLSRVIKRNDKIGTVAVRCGINRYSYEIPTGLYLIGDKEYAKDVIVTCNYKLTIDILRSNIKAKGLYLLVLDTFGINVWCAAGKGTFSSRELIYQIVKSDIKKKLKIRKIILPQLGATSMEAAIIRKMSGLSVVYGPVRAEDIDRFLENSYTADEDMRRVEFPFVDRLKLIPLEFIQSLKYVLISLIAFIFYSLIFDSSNNLFFVTTYYTSTILILSIIGSLVFPLVINVLSFKAFSYKNIILSMPFIVSFTIYELLNKINESLYITLSLIIIRLMYAAFIGFRFTGSTTFTSFSGAKHEGALIVKSSKVATGIVIVLLFASKLLN